MATHSSILTWRIPWTEESGRLQSRGSQRAGHGWVTEHVDSEVPGFDPASYQPHDPESLAQNFFQSTVALRVFCPDEGAGSAEEAVLPGCQSQSQPYFCYPKEARTKARELWLQKSDAPGLQFCDRTNHFKDFPPKEICATWWKNTSFTFCILEQKRTFGQDCCNFTREVTFFVRALIVAMCGDVLTSCLSLALFSLSSSHRCLAAEFLFGFNQQHTISSRCFQKCLTFKQIYGALLMVPRLPYSVLNLVCKWGCWLAWTWTDFLGLLLLGPTLEACQHFEHAHAVFQGDTGPVQTVGLGSTWFRLGWPAFEPCHHQLLTVWPQTTLVGHLSVEWG